MPRSTATRRSHLTFQGNLKSTRYGWLRLTPAYSVHLVEEILGSAVTPGTRVLDPFCGTGTTALVCAERGLAADTTDINPFLLWLTKAKTRRYRPVDLDGLARVAPRIEAAIGGGSRTKPWVPALHQIDKWWERAVLEALGRAMAELRRIEAGTPPAVVDLLKVAFCQTMIEHANVSFGHQSMSFRRRRERLPGLVARVAETWTQAALVVGEGATSTLETTPSVVLCDARDLRRRLGQSRYGCVITSPPYPNRMSYIRELRPYMYWLGYLRERHDAGELDWQAIGGTWGAATVRVGKWRPPPTETVPYRGWQQILARIAEHSPLLSRYVEKYFHDMAQHCRALHRYNSNCAYVIQRSY